MPTDLPRVFHGSRRWLLAKLLANGFGQAAAAVATALLVEHGFDRLLGTHPEPQRLAHVGAGLLAAASTAALLRLRERIDAECLGQDYIHELRLLLFDRLVATAPRSLQQRSQGSVVLRFVGDLTAVRQWVSLGLARLTVAAMMTAGTLMALTVVSPSLALVIAVLLAVGAAAALSQGGGLRAAALQARRRHSNLAANVNEKVSAVAVVQAFGQVERERRRIDRQSRRLRQAMIDRARYAGRLRAITEGTAASAIAAVLLTGVLQGASPGIVAAAMAIVGLLVSPLRDLGRVQEHWHNARVARDKLSEFFARPGVVSDRPGATDLPPGPGRLELVDVRLGGVLHGVSAVAEPGQVVVIAGPNGAGKTTLLTLVARLMEPEGGQILLDGHDLAEHTLASVRRRISLAGGDLPLLRGTVERNLRYRWPSASRKELARVGRMCGLDEVLAELRDGARTRVAEGGAGLSAGQRQRIALARALLGDPAVLLLDEADANLDQDAATVIDRVLAEHRGTVLLVTHRPERIAAADVVWHLREGRIVEHGPPSELLTRDGPTAQLLVEGSTLAHPA